MLNFLKKVLFQPVRPFKTTQPIAYLLKSDRLSQLWGWKPFSSFMYVLPGLRSKHTQLDVNERIVEVPFAFNQVGMPRPNLSKILDVGCMESTFGISLASLGFKVTGMDIRPYELTHPNFKFVQADICQNRLKANTFDAVTCISTLEHIGLNTIYGPADDTTDDQRAIDQMHRLLKPGGKLILTTPASKVAYASSFMRHYTPAQLKTLLRNFTQVTIKYCTANPSRTYWRPAASSKLPGKGKFGVALITAVK